ncbi:hypothetical protein H8959_010704 [Pygathrix nigripes]
MATSSMCKGCFVFKPNSKKRKISVPIEDYFNKGKHEPEDSKLRFETYQLIWQQMKSENERLQEELNKNLFDSLIEFLQKSHSAFQKNSRDLAGQIKLREIPTAALVLGVNVTDHDLTFRSLTEALQNNVTPYVVSLQAKDCPDMKHFLQKLVSQLMDCCVDIKSKEEESVQVTQRKTHYSMDSLSSWYMTVTQKTDPKMPSKKRTTSSQWQSPPVVVILKDMESFATKVLQDFIIISSQHLHEFPLILIFGIATSPIIIHRLLPHAVSSLLCIELFQSLSCKEHLTTVLDKLLLTTQFPFKINEKVLQVLTNIFLYHDFSIQNFIKGLQLSLLEHFYSQPLSVLCCNLPEAKRRINFLSNNQCENIRRLPSFRRYVEKQTSEKQVALLTSERCLKEETQLLLENLHVYHMNYFLVLRCLHKFTSSLPKYPLGRQVIQATSFGIYEVGMLVFSCFGFCSIQASECEMKPIFTMRAQSKSIPAVHITDQRAVLHMFRKEHMGFRGVCISLAAAELTRLNNHRSDDIRPIQSSMTVDIPLPLILLLCLGRTWKKR